MSQSMWHQIFSRFRLKNLKAQNNDILNIFMVFRWFLNWSTEEHVGKEQCSVSHSIRICRWDKDLWHVSDRVSTVRRVLCGLTHIVGEKRILGHISSHRRRPAEVSENHPWILEHFTQFQETLVRFYLYAHLWPLDLLLYSVYHLYLHGCQKCMSFRLFGLDLKENCISALEE